MYYREPIKFNHMVDIQATLELYNLKSFDQQ